MIAVLLFAFRVTVIVTGDQYSEIDDIDNVQQITNMFVDSMATILALSISVIQSAHNYKKNRIAFCFDVAALACCVLCLVSWPAIRLWQEHGTYIGLFFILMGLCIEPACDRSNESNNEGWQKRINRWIAIVLSFLMIAMAAISFVKGTPQFSISDGVIYLFVLVIVLLVWDSIESFSLGNLVTLKLKIKEKEKENENLTSENNNLRNQILSVINHNQSVTVQVNAGESKVESAIKDDSKHEMDDVEYGLIDTIIEVDTHKDSESIEKKVLPCLVEQRALSKFAQINCFSQDMLQRDVKFSQKFIDSEPLMVRDVIFDGYAKRSLDELFIEVMFQQNWRTAVDVAYFRLSQINRYAQENKVNAKMVIVIPTLSAEGLITLFGRATKKPDRLKAYLRQIYEPAIKRGLLEVVEIEISDEEIYSMRRETLE